MVYGALVQIGFFATWYVRSPSELCPMAPDCSVLPCAAIHVGRRNARTRLAPLVRVDHVTQWAAIATDDESYTYNSRINRVSSIQEHLMIKRAIKRGVPPERLAKALNVNASTIVRKATLLEGICPEAAELLKDRQFGINISTVLRKMKPTRQVECVELFSGAGRRQATRPVKVIVADHHALACDAINAILIGELVTAHRPPQVASIRFPPLTNSRLNQGITCSY